MPVLSPDILVSYGRLGCSSNHLRFLIAQRKNRNQLPEELRCLYLLSAVKRKVGNAEWNYARLCLNRPCKSSIFISHTEP